MWQSYHLNSHSEFLLSMSMFLNIYLQSPHRLPDATDWENNVLNTASRSNIGLNREMMQRMTQTIKTPSIHTNFSPTVNKTWHNYPPVPRLFKKPNQQFWFSWVLPYVMKSTLNTLLTGLNLQIIQFLRFNLLLNKFSVIWHQRNPYSTCASLWQGRLPSHFYLELHH